LASAAHGPVHVWPPSKIPTSPPFVHNPYKMADWATCRDGVQVYSRNAQFPLEPPAEVTCALHGGVRALGPGKRLNER
jgi:hypothetical protein